MDVGARPVISCDAIIINLTWAFCRKHGIRAVATFAHEEQNTRPGEIFEYPIFLRCG